MIEIICGTNRPGSRSLEVCQIVQKLYAEQRDEAQILEIADVGLNEMSQAPYSDERPKALVDAIDRVNQASGLVVVCPEYNGSYPGILKYFIDHWHYPLSYESRPISFIGLGGRFGGLRPVEHLQGVFGYRNSYIFPERVFLSNIWSVLQDGKIVDETMYDLLKAQVKAFSSFIKGLESQGLDALSKAKSKATS